jgi:hypothetical protein
MNALASFTLNARGIALVRKIMSWCSNSLIECKHNDMTQFSTLRQDVTENLVVTDFLVEVGSKRVALECKFNLRRDTAKTLISARLIRQQFGCDEVLIIVPFYEEAKGDDLESKKNIRILPLQDLADLIDSWINS